MSEQKIARYVCDNCSVLIDEFEFAATIDCIPNQLWHFTIYSVEANDPPNGGGPFDQKNKDLCATCAEAVLDALMILRDGRQR